MLLAACGIIWWVVTQSSLPGGSSVGVRGESEDMRWALPIPAQPRKAFGRDSATLAFVIYSDFECRYCAKLAKEALPALREAYIEPGAIRIEFRHLPLPGHAYGREAAVAAECAAQNGQFWATHDALFAGDRVVGTAGGDEDNCKRDSAQEAVLNDLLEAAGLGFRSTPTVLVAEVLDSGALRPVVALRGARSAGTYADLVREWLGHDLKVGDHLARGGVR